MAVVIESDRNGGFTFARDPGRPLGFCGYPYERYFIKNRDAFAYRHLVG